MSKNFGVVFGGVLASVLLAIFFVSTIYMVYDLWASCGEACGENAVKVSDGLRHVYTTIGGLISAFVIAQLSVTKPGDAMTVGNFRAETKEGQEKTALVAGLYLGVWAFCGVLALIVGVIFYNKANTMLSDYGTGWLGMAVSAAYAYFGINPPDQNSNGAGGDAAGNA